MYMHKYFYEKKKMIILSQFSIFKKFIIFLSIQILFMSPLLKYIEAFNLYVNISRTDLLYIFI